MPSNSTLATRSLAKKYADEFDYKAELGGTILDPDGNKFCTGFDAFVQKIGLFKIKQWVVRAYGVPLDPEITNVTEIAAAIYCKHRI